jgi:hypothetical protein
MRPLGSVKIRDAIIETLTKDGMDVTELVRRVRGMFLEVPGTRLSVIQAARLAGIEPSVCRQILESLIERHVLKLSSDETFMLR